MSAAITWPERPTCHDKDLAAQHFGPTVWRPADQRGFRTCGFCGSIHPEDLLRVLQAGARLECADWKYGWPHKFYVSNIPNPNHGKLVPRVWASDEWPVSEARSEHWNKVAQSYGGRLEFEQSGPAGCKVTVLAPDGPTTHAKWYNVHLSDLSAEAFDALAPRLGVTGISFGRNERGVFWSGVPRGLI